MYGPSYPAYSFARKNLPATIRKALAEGVSPLMKDLSSKAIKTALPPCGQAARDRRFFVCVSIRSPLALCYVSG